MSFLRRRNNEIEEIIAVEYLKSSLSISNYVVCGLGCKYCSVQEFASSRVNKIMEAEEAFEKLIENPLFFKDYTPITINNRTDPMLPQVKNDTFKIIKLLEVNGFKNICIIISKMELLEEELSFFEECKIPIVYIVSYGNFSTSSY